MKSSKLFYINCPIGLEKNCLEELKLKAELLDINIEIVELAEAGMYIEADLSDLRRLQYYLKTCNRILLILDSFKCKDLPKLFQKAQKIDWNSYLLNGEYSLKAVASKSRLNNEKRITQTFEDAMKAYFKAKPPKKFKNNQYRHEIRIRCVDDQLSISIDLSGEHLHQRSGRTNQIAPLRETYAAMAYFLLAIKADEVSSLIDPMCGSGSMAMEALNFYEPSRRDFAINHIREFEFSPKLKLKNLKTHKISQIHFNDISQKALKTAVGNLEDLELSESLKINSTEFDICDSNVNLPLCDALLCNLPYDERIPFSNKQYRQSLTQIQKLFSNSACLVIPESKLGLAREVLCNIKSEMILFRNGGLRTCFVILKK